MIHICVRFAETISLAHAVTKYTSDDPDILSFEHGQTIRIYSKSAGNRMDLWGCEVNGKRGYVPFKMLREFHIYEHAPNFVLPTQVRDDVFLDRLA